MVALVRGVHGLNGAVRVEVLTDRPEDRFVAGAVLYREGDDRPLTIATAEAVADGPGWRIRFREVATRDARRRACAARTSSRSSGRTRTSPAARTTGTRSSARRARRRRRRARDGQGHLPVGETEVFTVDGGPYGAFDLPAVRAFIRIFAPRRGEIVVDAESLDLRPRRSRDAGSRPAEGAAAADAEQGARPTTGGSDAPRRPTDPTRPPATDAMTLEIDVLTLFPAMVEGAARPEHPGPDPGAGPRHDPDPRPARVGDRPPPVRRRHAVRRGSGDDPAPGAGRRRPSTRCAARTRW